MDILINELAPKKYVKGLVNDEQKQMRYKTIPLTNTIKKNVRRNKNAKTIKAKEKRNYKFLEFSKNEKNYSLYIPLHQLWKDYMEKLLAGCDDEKEMEKKVSKADLHGCLIRVIKSKCPLLVGIQGITLIESKNMFNVITKDNEVKKVPKFNTTFSFFVKDVEVLICGDNFRYKASERTVRNFKTKPLIEIKNFQKFAE